MARATIEFKKGDGVTHYFRIPVDSWSAGGKLFFAAKTAPDDDATDSQAVIDKEFDDTNIVAISHDEYVADQVTYEMYFGAADMTAVTFSDGSKKKEYLGEFQYVPLTGDPTSYPGTDDFIKAIVYADIKRGIA